MSAPDFYFAVNEIFRHIHDQYGMEALIDYWHKLGSEHYRQRNQRWRAGGAGVIAQDWREYFSHEPGAEVSVIEQDGEVALDIRICPAIHHLRTHQREIVDYFCEHCDHVCGAQADAAGFAFQREGGMGSCRQRFVPLSVAGVA
ncbi:MAG: hypothetical protein IT445_10225 [Phycisphaeraceae bacterium]|nr:hypothetical protein [Phycisphaeraceae bacterium]